MIGSPKSPAPAGDALGRLVADHPTLDALMTGLTEGSPYLWDLVRRSPQRLVALIEAEPVSRFTEILADARHAIAATRDEAEVMAPASRHEDGGGAVDRARRSGRRLGRSTGDRAADCPCRRGRGCRGRLSPLRRATAGKAQRHRSGRARRELGLCRHRHGQDGRGRAQLFERYRHHRVLRRRRACSRNGAGRLLRAAHARAW